MPALLVVPPGFVSAVYDERKGGGRAKSVEGYIHPTSFSIQQSILTWVERCAGDRSLRCRQDDWCECSNMGVGIGIGEANEKDD